MKSEPKSKSRDCQPPKYQNFEIVWAKKSGSPWEPAKILEISESGSGNAVVMFILSQKMSLSSYLDPLFRCGIFKNMQITLKRMAVKQTLRRSSNR